MQLEGHNAPPHLPSVADTRVHATQRGPTHNLQPCRHTSENDSDAIVLAYRIRRFVAYSPSDSVASSPSDLVASSPSDFVAFSLSDFVAPRPSDFVDSSSSTGVRKSGGVEPVGGFLQDMQAAFYRSVGDMTGAEAVAKLTSIVHNDCAGTLGAHIPLPGRGLGNRGTQGRCPRTPMPSSGRTRASTSPCPSGRRRDTTRTCY